MTDDPEITDPRDPYKRPDIVTALDRWLGVYHLAGLIDVAVIQRARAEIVALQTRLLEQNAISVTLENAHAVTRIARDDALEEAARLCEGGYTTGSTASTLKALAAAIRALKDA